MSELNGRDVERAIAEAEQAACAAGYAKALEDVREALGLEGAWASDRWTADEISGDLDQLEARAKEGT